MQTRPFGPTGRSVPVIGIGTWNMESDDRKAAIAAVRRAVELGMVHVDTAELYGSGAVETMLGEALSGLRDRVFLVSKVLPRNASYAGTLRACEASLRRLRTDHLDCYLLHWREELPLGETFRAFETLREQGKIRSWGVSNFDDDDLAEAHALVGAGKIACNQVLYHLGQRDIEHRVMPWCEEHGVAVVAYSPLGGRGGFRTAPALAQVARRLHATARQVALAFLARPTSIPRRPAPPAEPSESPPSAMSRRSSTFVIPKSSNAAHVDELAGADRVTLDAGAIEAIEAAYPLAPWRGLPTL